MPRCDGTSFDASGDEALDTVHTAQLAVSTTMIVDMAAVSATLTWRHGDGADRRGRDPALRTWLAG